MNPGGFLVVLVTAAACGRIQFDAGSDAAADARPAHDEDGDGLVDERDGCPHISDPGQDDADGDGVGDACDPNMFVGTERIVVFDPLVDPAVDLMPTNAVPVLDGESISADTRDGELLVTLRDVVPATDTITIGGASATNRRQVQLSARESDARFIYCEFYEQGGIVKWGLVWIIDTSGFTTVDNGNLTAPLANQDFRMSLAANPATTDTSCSTTFPVDKVLLDSPIAGIAPTYYTIYWQGLELRLDYVIVIRTE